jgi:hypothetical protein
MMPTLASTWRKVQLINGKRDVDAHSSHSEVISGMRLRALSSTTPETRSRASSVEVTTTGISSTTGEQDRSSEWIERMRPRESSACTGLLQLKVFVGSWNMATADPFVDSTSYMSVTGTYMGDAAAGEKLEVLLPPGYDLYVLGTQEKVTKHLHTAVLARLHAAPEHLGRRFVTMRPLSQNEKERRRSSTSKRTRSHSTDCSSESSESDGHVERFRHNSIAVEMSTSGYAARHGADTNQEDASSESTQEVRGRGDGAFLSTKSTSIAVYCAHDLTDVVEIDAIATHKFSWTSGSKGGVAVTVSIAADDGDKQTLTFANCHLEANKPTLRRQQLATLSTKLGQALRGDDAKDLASSSDHVVWMGDFNYRIHTLDGETVLQHLGTGNHLDVHDQYDSMKDDLAVLPTMSTFAEPRKWPTFLPTYKKIPDRPTSVDMADPDWPSRVYRVLYKEPFYKGGQTKARVPGWCDRILYCSRGDGGLGGSRLSVEQVEGRDNYRSVNDGLCESDHSPVFCTFDWTISNAANVCT